MIAVSDRGPGVPEDRLEMIFDRFTKVDPSRSGGSSGLGLAIAAEHAALMGGYLQAMNRDGGGLRLELDPAEATLPDRYLRAMRRRHSGATIRRLITRIQEPTPQ